MRLFVLKQVRFSDFAKQAKKIGRKGAKIHSGIKCKAVKSGVVIGCKGSAMALFEIKERNGESYGVKKAAGLVRVLAPLYREVGFSCGIFTKGPSDQVLQFRGLGKYVYHSLPRRFWEDMEITAIEFSDPAELEAVLKLGPYKFTAVVCGVRSPGHLHSEPCQSGILSTRAEAQKWLQAQREARTQVKAITPKVPIVASF